MRSLHDRKEINDFLGRKGLATLDNPAGMVQHLGFLVRGHEHFRQLLTRCEPAERYNMYESLRPHLQFEAKPLDVYISEAGQQAEAEQLPTIGPDGNFQPFHQAEIRTGDGQVATTEYSVDRPEEQSIDPTEKTDTAIAQAAVNQQLAKKWLEVTCKRCTKEATFTGDWKTDCYVNMRIAGWRYVPAEDGGYDLCPDCVDGAAR